MKKLLIAALLLVPFLVAPPAQAANSYVLDCLNPPPTTLVLTEVVGDTFTFDAPNCQLRGYDPSYVNNTMFTPLTATPPYMWIGPQTFTMQSATSVFITVNNPATPTTPYNVALRAAAAPNPPAPSPSTPTADPVPAGPAPLGQGLPVPESGDCRDINDEDAVWATHLKGGWHISWSTWRLEDGTIFHDYWSCVRTIEYVNGEWRVKPLDDGARLVIPTLPVEEVKS